MKITVMHELAGGENKFGLAMLGAIFGLPIVFLLAAGTLCISTAAIIYVYKSR